MTGRGDDNGPGGMPKRHHFVPKAYSRAWANAEGQVLVRRRGRAEPFVTSIDNVGVDAGIYGSGALASHRESTFGKSEAAWPRLRQLLATTGHVSARDRPAAALFIGLQIARTREHLASATFLEDLVETIAERPISRDHVRSFIQQRLGHEPDDQEVEGAWTLASYLIQRGGLRTFDEAFSMTIDIAVTKLVPLVDALHWRVEIVDKPLLWMSDRPVMPWRPPSEADAYEGLGYGDCDEVRMPLSPTAMLVMTRRVPKTPLMRVSTQRFHDYNEDIAAQCHEFIACAPGRPGRFAAVGLASSRPAVRFNVGPGYSVEPDGTRAPMGDILHSWIPLRAGAQ